MWISPPPVWTGSSGKNTLHTGTVMMHFGKQVHTRASFREKCMDIHHFTKGCHLTSWVGAAHFSTSSVHVGQKSLLTWTSTNKEQAVTGAALSGPFPWNLRVSDALVYIELLCFCRRPTCLPPPSLPGFSSSESSDLTRDDIIPPRACWRRVLKTAPEQSVWRRDLDR